MFTLAPDVKKEIETVLGNWARWCQGGWPPLDYTELPTSRDYLPKDQRDKPPPRIAYDVPSAEAANMAIVNLALNGDTRSYQVIAAWWAHHRGAKAIAKVLHCSVASVYNYRDVAMEAFWGAYHDVRAQNRRKMGSELTV